ncbi:hypothetical protein BOTBODRAFT_290124 [Botryobasidium botryosum FD-172 SS1]|uniref:Uncharacterized protein n=1 Tax=Botryobasidium botryosum (strain FD-172 SS1) TaxID=930990 RepID=A0A067MHY4_BOTB1|nr:hypothetical protein BOTBODRAFT_290124 [Botryobasidium botryosum FD-172 SS1]
MRLWDLQTSHFLCGGGLTQSPERGANVASTYSCAPWRTQAVINRYRSRLPIERWVWCCERSLKFTRRSNPFKARLFLLAMAFSVGWRALTATRRT